MPSSNKVQLALPEIARYLMAGAINTLAGYGVFLALFRLCQVRPEIANVLAYAVGLAIAFTLNRYYVFKGASMTPRAAVRFVVGFGLSFMLNMATLALLIRGGMHAEIAQIFAMSVYTVSFYLINKVYVWNSRP